ncbi:MAG TPA: response regulator [Candidatus Binataceae bacterium]|nr:response regulator [Candidatus Binataceae bacterium]
MHERILIVDACRETLDLARRVLANERYDVEVASSAEQALEIAQRLRPQLILTDLRLPGPMGALGMVAWLRAQPALRRAAIMVVTTDASEAEHEEALASGCDEFISQPLTTAMLRERVSRWVSRDPAASRLSPSGGSWLRRLFGPARRRLEVKEIPAYRAGSRLPVADHFAPPSRSR